MKDEIIDRLEEELIDMAGTVVMVMLVVMIKLLVG